MENAVKVQIIEALEAYMLQHKLSQNKVESKSGVNVAYIKAMRGGETLVNSGGGNWTEIANKWYEKIALYIGFPLEKEYWKTVPTEQMTRIIATLEDAKMFGYTNVIIGQTGCGKTYITQKFADKNPEEVFVVTVSQTDSIGDLLDKVIAKLGLVTSSKSKSKKLREINSFLREMKFKGLKPMLVFDEAEYMKQPALCAMKEFYDHLQGICALVMLGTNQLTQNLEQMKKRNKAGIPQFYRRIKFGIRPLSAIKNFKEFTKDIEDAGLRKFLDENCENYGELHDVLVPAMREADRTGEVLNENFVRKVLNIPN